MLQKMNMIFQLKSYIKFLVKVSLQPGIHSPFIYGLVSQCFKDKTKKKWYEQAENYRDSLLKNTTTISIEDFGAGSKSLQMGKRKISKIAKKAGIPLKRGQLLGRMIAYFNPKEVLEIGTSVGLATSAMSFANSSTHITTLEGCTSTANIAKEYFNKFELNNINLITGNFDTTLTDIIKQNVFDFIYFDGNHQKEATIRYFEQCLSNVHNDSVFIFDDIYWNKGMKEAWLYIKAHPKVTVTVDTYFWGIVFFRKEQKKEHFTIRL
jgi:predicted O-methyltransferase YrrM